jgi:hypothetical protein
LKESKPCLILQYKLVTNEMYENFVFLETNENKKYDMEYIYHFLFHFFDLFLLLYEMYLLVLV